MQGPTVHPWSGGRQETTGMVRVRAGLLVTALISPGKKGHLLKCERRLHRYGERGEVESHYPEQRAGGGTGHERHRWAGPRARLSVFTRRLLVVAESFVLACPCCLLSQLCSSRTQLGAPCLRLSFFALLCPTLSYLAILGIYVRYSKMGSANIFLKSDR